ncbi:type II toxin-antitoxin system VapC family toxin [bacterium]|nr:type II toxin-antitoxin system VapC family toxin [bacterium]
MASRRVLVDTSLFIEHLRARDKMATHLFRLSNESTIETCAIVAAEIFYGARQPEAEEQAKSVLFPFQIHAFTIEMALRASAIVQSLKKINKVQDLRDVMVAATALELGIDMVTLNRKHFEKIPGLRIKDLPRFSHQTD